MTPPLDVLLEDDVDELLLPPLVDDDETELPEEVSVDPLDEVSVDALEEIDDESLDEADDPGCEKDDEPPEEPTCDELGDEEDPLPCGDPEDMGEPPDEPPPQPAEAAAA